MNKLETLKDWVNPRYLQNLDPFDKDDLEAGVVLDDFLDPARLALVENFMSSEAEYRELYRIVDKTDKLGVPEVTREEWQACPPSRRFCFRKLVSGARSGFHESRNYLAYRELWSFFESTLFAYLLAKLTGEIYRPSVWAAISHEQEHFLVPHTDNRADRKLNVIFYLSSGWKENFGGELTLLEDGKRSKSVAPLFNRLVLLKPRKGNEHQVEFLTPEAETWQRFCFVIRCTDPLAMADKKSQDDY